MGDSKLFFSRLLGFSHIFSTATYFLRIWPEALRILSQVVIAHVDDPDSGFTEEDMDDEEAFSGKKALLLFLVQAMLRKQHVSVKINDAVVTICSLLNYSCLAGPYHVCKGDGCVCQRYGGPRLVPLVLVASITVLLCQLPVVPSETCWTTTRSTAAYAAIWLLLCNLGSQAML